ncbi:MAG: hypothetical protein AB7G80_00185 [Dongiaceae bacterium]
MATEIESVDKVTDRLSQAMAKLEQLMTDRHRAQAEELTRLKKELSESRTRYETLLQTVQNVEQRLDTTIKRLEGSVAA